MEGSAVVSIPSTPTPKPKVKKVKVKKIHYTPQQEEEFWDTYKRKHMSTDEDDEEEPSSKRPRLDDSMPLWKKLYYRYKEKLEKKENRDLKEWFNFVYKMRKSKEEIIMNCTWCERKVLQRKTFRSHHVQFIMIM